MHDSKLEDFGADEEKDQITVRTPTTEEERARIAKLRAEGKTLVLAPDDMVE